MTSSDATTGDATIDALTTAVVMTVATNLDGRAANDAATTTIDVRGVTPADASVPTRG